MKERFFERLGGYVFPGKNPKDEFLSSIVFGIMWAAFSDIKIFFVRYFGVLEDVRNLRAGGDVVEVNAYVYLMEGDDWLPTMPGFATLTDYCLVSIHIYVIYRVIKAIFEMFYFTSGSNSTYVMRRLDEKFPIVRRCWAKALVGIAAALLAGLLLYFINYLVYVNYTPAEFCPYTTGASFLRALYGGRI